LGVQKKERGEVEKVPRTSPWSGTDHVPSISGQSKGERPISLGEKSKNQAPHPPPSSVRHHKMKPLCNEGRGTETGNKKVPGPRDLINKAQVVLR